MARRCFMLGTLFAFLAVAAGAFGAHALKTILSAEMLAVFDTAARYQMYHALALFVAGWAAGRYRPELVRAAGRLFVLGIVLFSGSLYILSLTGIRWFGAVTPLGGLAFLGGWALLGWAALQKSDE